MEVGRHEVPDFAGVHLRTELGPLPAADIGVGRVHAGADSRRGSQERQTRLARAVGEVVVVDADDAVFERLTVRELHRELGTGIHRGLRLGVSRGSLALRGDVLGDSFLLLERPVLRVLGDSCLDGRGISPGGTAAGCSAALGASASPAVHRVADQVELVSDGPGHAGSREHDDQTDDRDDQDVLDDRLPSETGTPRRYPPPEG